MVVFVGFDMVPKLTAGEGHQAQWDKFLADVMVKFGNGKDINFMSTADGFQFKVGGEDRPFLPLSGSTFVSFRSKSSRTNTDGEIERCVKDVYHVAKKLFASRVVYWCEGNGERKGFMRYLNEDVQRVQGTAPAPSTLKAATKNVNVNTTGSGKTAKKPTSSALVFDDENKENHSQSGGLGPQGNLSHAVDKECYPKFNVGEIVQEYVEPMMKILIPTEKGKRCSLCFEECDIPQKCEKCKLTTYCNKKCRSDDSKLHQIECNIPFYHKTTAISGSDTEKKATFQVLHTLAALKLNPSLATKKYYLYNGLSKTFMDVWSNELDHVNVLSVSSVAKAITAKLVQEKDCLIPDFLMVGKRLDAMGEEQPPHLADKMLAIQKIIGLWQKFGVDIPCEDGITIVGQGLFLETAFIPHSCKPTTSRTVSYGRMEIRSIVKTGFKEQQTICLLPNFQHYKQRQAYLKSQFGISCQCDMCKEEMVKESFDYNHLNWLLDADKYDKECKWTVTPVILQDVEDLLSKLLFPLDERVTKIRIGFVRKLMKASEEHPSKDLSKIITDLSERVAKAVFVTYGPEHQLTDRLKQEFITFKVNQRSRHSSSSCSSGQDFGYASRPMPEELGFLSYFLSRLQRVHEMDGSSDDEEEDYEDEDSSDY